MPIRPSPLRASAASAVELIGLIELAISLGTAAGVQQLPWRELG
jgi:hypothetical protein